MINIINHKLYRIRRTVSKLFIEAKVFFSFPSPNEKYQFNSAKNIGKMFLKQREVNRGIQKN